LSKHLKRTGLYIIVLSGFTNRHGKMLCQTGVNLSRDQIIIVSRPKSSEYISGNSFSVKIIALNLKNLYNPFRKAFYWMDFTN